MDEQVSGLKGIGSMNESYLQNNHNQLEFEYILTIFFITVWQNPKSVCMLKWGLTMLS